MLFRRNRENTNNINLEEMQPREEVMPEDIVRNNVEEGIIQHQEEVEYLQWFQKDRKRFEDECDLMSRNFPGFNGDMVILPDGRLSFSFNLKGFEVCCIFPYIYPLAPPKVFILNEADLLGRYIEKDNSLDYLSNRREWKPTEYAATAITWVEDIITIEYQKNLKPDKESNNSELG